MPILNPKGNGCNAGGPNPPKAPIFSSPSKEEDVKFVSEEPRWSLDEIVLNSSVRETVNDVITFCLNKDTLVKDWKLDKFLKGSSSIGINLYGEPGTGKSITAEAIAKALGKKLIKVDYSQIKDCKVGATEKHLTSLFQQAEMDDCVIFMDEADGLLSKRSTRGDDTSGSNDIKSHLLTLVDKHNVVIIYATNLFKNFDRAFFRRILYHIKYPLPTQAELVELWKFHLGEEKIPKDTNDFSFEEIAKMSEGELAGGDIKNITLKLCVKLAAGKVQAISNAVVRHEIDRYIESLQDSRGARKVSDSELTDEEKKAVKEERERLGIDSSNKTDNK